MGLGIRKNDNVLVISGRYKGVEGKVLAVFPSTDKALVQGVNEVKKHSKARGQQDPGGIITKEMPIHLSNLMLVDKTGRASRYGNEVDEKGTKIRRSKATGNEV